MSTRLSQRFSVPIQKTPEDRLFVLVETTIRLSAGLLFLFCLVLPPNVSSSGYTRAAALSSWSLVWSDEFSGSNESPIDTKWTAKVGGGGWGNNELQYYTARLDNAYQSGG